MIRVFRAIRGAQNYCYEVVFQSTIIKSQNHVNELWHCRSFTKRQILYVNASYLSKIHNCCFYIYLIYPYYLSVMRRQFYYVSRLNYSITKHFIGPVKLPSGSILDTLSGSLGAFREHCWRSPPWHIVNWASQNEPIATPLLKWSLRLN